MKVFKGLGGWPGKAEGRVVWVEPRSDWGRGPVADRAAEIERVRRALAEAAEVLEGWMAQQTTLGGRLLLQHCEAALADSAFTGRVTMLIDVHGLPGPAALVEAAELVARVMMRSPELQEKAQALPVAARWLAGRLDPVEHPADAILVGRELSPLELLDWERPAIMAAGDPGIVGKGPLVWGVPQVDPGWSGREARIDGLTVAIGEAAPVRAASAPAEVCAAIRRSVVEIAQRMRRDGLVRLTAGNVSCRIPGTELFAITPSGMEYEELEPQDICILDLHGRPVDAGRRPSTEEPLHRLTYQRRPDVQAIVHTHSLYASAFACTGQELPVISTELAGLVGGTGRCAPYAPSGTMEFAETAMRALGEGEVALLFQNHGVLALGGSLKEAYSVAVGVEEAARLYFIVRQIGTPIILPEEERRRIFRVMHTTYGQSGEGS